VTVWKVVSVVRGVRVDECGIDVWVIHVWLGSDDCREKTVYPRLLRDDYSEVPEKRRSWKPLGRFLRKALVRGRIS